MVIRPLEKSLRPQPREKALPAILTALCCWLICATPGHALPAQSRSAKARVPPYHASPPRGRLPQVLPWTEFTGNPFAENAYCFAAKIRPVLYQQPCYCPCRRDLGHTCLLDCFTLPDKHAAICATCLQEAIFAYRQTMTGADAKTIRAEIIKGEWKKVNLQEYTRPPAR